MALQKQQITTQRSIKVQSRNATPLSLDCAESLGL